ncbi:cyclic nucleotide-binding domain-containing protein [Caldimonas tepidiphila]|uniref:cyclic nucleotide-binding domain-containing protein n=1 Tax=Caldimonas tepidiphila TaxID=2315841 RepID=UPI000E5C2DA9|nr:cyclic nucleotide-binding domain-containing protein [Caldimonas tepidiphila]
MDFEELVDAIQLLNTEDAFRPRLDAAQWRLLGGYLDRSEVAAGELAIRQDDTARGMHFLGQGSMQVFRRGGPPGSLKVAILRPGAVLGEPSLFGEGPRMASVEAMTPCLLWTLTPQRFDEMTQCHPALALEVMRAAGAVMAARLRASIARQMPIP